MNEKEQLNPARYTSTSYGVTEHPDGPYVLRADVIKAIELVNDDDSCIHGRLYILLENLEREEL